MGSIVEAVSSPEFLTGLRWGGIAAAAALLVGIAWRRWREEPAPVAGLAVVVAVALGMPMVRPLHQNLLAGLGFLVIAGATFPWTRRLPLVPFLMAFPGAWLIGRSDLPGPGWLMPLVILVTAAGGPVLSWFDENGEGSGAPMLLFAISAAGVWATVPDTEEALVLLGTMAVPTLLAWPLRLANLGPIGAHTLVGLFVWVVAWGGRGREGSIIGAIGCLGLLLVEPLARGLAGRRKPQSRIKALPLILIHLLMVGFAARVAGFRTSPVAAGSIVAATLALGAMACWVLYRWRSEPVRTDPQSPPYTSNDV